MDKLIKKCGISAACLLRKAGAWAGFLGICWMFFVVSGCATPTTVERWHMTEAKLGALSAQEEGVPGQDVRVIFFREVVTSAKAAQPVNIYINGRYQASLVGDTYTEKSLCPGIYHVSAQFNDVRERYLTKRREGMPVTVSSAPVQYFRVSEDAAGGVILESVKSFEENAISSLKHMQIHTLSRVVGDGCRRS